MLQVTRRWNTALTTALLFLVAVPAFAKELTKQARSNDIASEYQLKDNGDLFRLVAGLKCQITTSVEDFKVSQHPKDAAMIYYVKGGNLYVLHNAKLTGDCPKASKKMIMANLAKKHGDYRYNVVPSVDTTIVNVALSQTGHFYAWDNTATVLSQHNVADYSLHGQFGVKGAAFSSYALFAISELGFVLKVKGLSPEDSKWDYSDRYSDLKEFKTKNHIQ